MSTDVILNKAWEIQIEFPDKTHFYTIIRKSVGMSPTEYREKAREADQLDTKN